MKRSTVIDFAETAMILTLIVFMAMIMARVHAIQGTARVVNYAGIVRGATQRLVKLELARMPNKELELQLDGILGDLQSESGGRNDLILLPDQDYQRCLNTLADTWGRLRASIEHLRRDGGNDKEVIDLSEVYYNMADDTVHAAEFYSQQLASSILLIERLAIILMVAEVMIIFYRSASNIKLFRRNRELRRMAFIDLHTGLPNKSKCEQLLASTEAVPPKTAVFMFDMNFLKRVNDEMGHDAGDSLIRNFAILLRNNIPPKHFVGRFGGDEFIAIAHNVSRADVEAITAKIEAAKNAFNTSDSGYTLSFAVGYALSDDFGECSYKTLLDKADFNMYEFKRQTKTGRDFESLR